MQEEINLLRQQVDANKKEFDEFKNSLIQHAHNGVDAWQVDFNNLSGLIKTVTSSAELTNITSSKPSSVRDQIFIDTTTATKKLYVYDAAGNVWRSCTIA